MDKAAAAIFHFEEGTGFKPFKKFHIEQAIAFKRKLEAAKNERTGKPLRAWIGTISPQESPNKMASSRASTASLETNA